MKTIQKPAVTAKSSKTEAAPPSKAATAKNGAAARAWTEGQLAYEAKRAAKAGMSLERWLTSKQRAVEAEARERDKAAEPAKPPKPPGFFSRLLDRAHKPL